MRTLKLKSSGVEFEAIAVCLGTALQVRDFTAHLLESLETAYQTDTPDAGAGAGADSGSRSGSGSGSGPRERSESIGGVFRTMAPFFRLYSTYYEHYSNASEQILELRQSKPLIHEFISEIEATPKCEGLSLSSYLIEPVQRVPR